MAPLDRQVMKPQDVLVLLRFATYPGAAWQYTPLARDLGLSLSETHASVQRSKVAGLLVPGDVGLVVVRDALAKFLDHGLRYVFPAEFTRVTRGVATATSALSDFDIVPPRLAMVWPWAEGDVRGQGLVPLYRSVPYAALADPRLHRMLALTDVLRIGSAREREAANTALRAEMGP